MGLCGGSGGPVVIVGVVVCAGSFVAADNRGRAGHRGIGGLATHVCDPESRCSAMLVFEDQFAFVPFLKPRAGLEDLFTSTARGGEGSDDEDEEFGEDVGLLNGSMLGTPFVLSLKALGTSGYVRDYVFLHGYMSPTVAILLVRCNGRHAGV